MSFLNSQQFSDLTKQYQIGELLAEPFVIEENRVWKLKTTRGEFALKHLRAGLLEEPQNPLQGERIARALASFHIPVVTALETIDKEIFCLLGGEKFMLFPWCSTVAVNHQNVSASQARQIGELVARIHRANLPLENITVAAWQDFKLTDWSIHFSLPFKIDWMQIQEWSLQCVQAFEQLQGAWVISHGDITEGNLIWDTNYLPHLIDWETAGWIHPQVELLGVAINWAGIVDGEINYDIYAEILAVYRAVGGVVTIDEVVLAAGLGSWLLWLSYCLERWIAGDKSVQVSIVETITAVERLVHSWPRLIVC